MRNRYDTPLALIIDDEPDIRELLEITLARMDVDSRAAASVQEAMAELAARRFDLCLVDMRLPDGSGIDIVRHVASDHADTPIAVITAHGNMQTAVESLKAGAFDFVSKPVELPVLRRLVQTALRLDRASGDDPERPADGELLWQVPGDAGDPPPDRKTGAQPGPGVRQRRIGEPAKNSPHARSMRAARGPSGHLSRSTAAPSPRS